MPAPTAPLPAELDDPARTGDGQAVLPARHGLLPHPERRCELLLAHAALLTAEPHGLAQPRPDRRSHARPLPLSGGSSFSRSSRTTPST